MRIIAQAILWTAQIYLLVGAVVALGFALFGIRRVLPEAGAISLGARLIVLPAATLLWPVTLYLWRSER